MPRPQTLKTASIPTTFYHFPTLFSKKANRAVSQPLFPRKTPPNKPLLDPLSILPIKSAAFASPASRIVKTFRLKYFHHIYHKKGRT